MIKFKRFGSSKPDGNNGEQTLVVFDGSVLVSTFHISEATDGKAVMLLEDYSDGWQGEPGREAPPELMVPQVLSEASGVMLEFSDTRSVDVLVEALNLLKADMESNKVATPEEK